MKKLLLATLLLAFIFPKIQAQISDERDAWGNYFTPIVAIEPVINQKNDPKWSETEKEYQRIFVQKLQNSCYTGLAHSTTAHFIDRTAINPSYFNNPANRMTPQYLLKITLHENDFIYFTETKSHPTDGFLFMTISLINIETSAIVKLFPLSIYASDYKDFSHDLNTISAESINTAIYGEVIEKTKELTKGLFSTVFEIKEIVQEDDDWVEWVALEDAHLNRLNFEQELSAVAVKKEYVRDGVAYRWTNKIGEMKQGTFKGKKDKKFFEITFNEDQKKMKKAFKNKEKVFGLKGN